MDGLKLTLRIIGVLLAIVGAIAAVYYAATKLIGTRYFSDDDADVIECDCCECEIEEENAEEAAE